MNTQHNNNTVTKLMYVIGAIAMVVCIISCLGIIVSCRISASESPVSLKDISFLTNEELSFVADQWNAGWPSGKIERQAQYIGKWLLQPQVRESKRRIEPLSIEVLTCCNSVVKPSKTVQNVESFKDVNGAYDGVFCWLRDSDSHGLTRIEVSGVLRLVDEVRNLKTVVRADRRFVLHDGKWVELGAAFRIISGIGDK